MTVTLRSLTRILYAHAVVTAGRASYRQNGRSWCPGEAHRHGVDDAGQGPTEPAKLTHRQRGVANDPWTRADTVRYMPSTTSRTTRTQRATVWRSRICPRRSKLLDKLPHVANAIETGLDWLRHTSPTRSSSCLAGPCAFAARRGAKPSSTPRKSGGPSRACKTVYAVRMHFSLSLIHI